MSIFRLVLAALFLLLQGVDTYQTDKLISKYGLGVEKNKIVRYIYRKFKSVGFILLKIISSIIIALAFADKNIWIILIIFVDMYLAYIVYINHRHSIGYAIRKQNKRRRL